MKKSLFALSIFAMAASSFAANPRFFATEPANKWTDAWPLGNGRLGALVFGQTGKETLELNETSIWAPPQDIPVNENGPEILKQIRELLLTDKPHAAEQMTQNQFLMAAEKVSSYQPLATLTIDHKGQGDVSAYNREIVMPEGYVKTTYTQGGTAYTRTAWADMNADVLVFDYKAENGTLNFTVNANRQGATVKVLGNNKLHLSGSTGNKGVAYDMVLEVKVKGGKVAPEGNGIAVTGASAATIRVAARTDYNFKDPTKPLTRNRLSACQKDLSGKASLAAHAKKFAAKFNQSYVTIPYSYTENPKSVQQLLNEAKSTKKISNDLLVLYYDYCRYLILSASRKGGMPANLQGIWNPLMNPPWDSDFHLDINLSMFYWPAPQWGLYEEMEPMVSFAEMGFKASEPIAKKMLGVPEGGFMVTSTDAWGYAVPFRLPCWGMYIVGGAWLLQDAERAWYVSHDADLRKRLLPLFKSQATFYKHWMIRNKEGKLASGPVVSPENSYRGADGNAAVDLGPAHEQELIQATLKSILAINPKDKLANDLLKDLALPKIASDGSLQEWSQPFPEVEPAHRHLSHVYGLMPGREWSLRRTPDFAEAIRKTLDKRVAAGHDSTGWSLAHMACLRVRLNDPDAAVHQLDRAPQFLFGNLFTSAAGFAQVSDMCGVAQVLNEMLMRCDEDVIEILPAMPSRYAGEGSFRLLADGGFWITADWKDGKVTSLSVEPTTDAEASLIVNGQTHKIGPKTSGKIL